MLQAVLHGKSKAKHEEDTLTSSVFGLLVLLPDPVLWEILRRATDGQLPPDGGALQDYAFWPHWNHEGTGNTRFVEPDVYLKFGRCTLIVEAKYGGFQYESQWQNEIRACRNECLLKGQSFLIALDGNAAPAPALCEGLTVLKSDWRLLCKAVSEYQEQRLARESPSVCRILELLLYVFKHFGILRMLFLDRITPWSQADFDGAAACFRAMRMDPFTPALKPLNKYSSLDLSSARFDNWAARFLAN